MPWHALACCDGSLCPAHIPHWISAWKETRVCPPQQPAAEVLLAAGIQEALTGCEEA